MYLGDIEEKIALPVMFIRDKQGKVHELQSLNIDEARGMIAFPYGKENVSGVETESLSLGGDWLVFVEGRLREVRLASSHGLEFGASKNGPFVTIPCDVAAFHAVFGQPVETKSVEITAP